MAEDARRVKYTEEMNVLIMASEQYNEETETVARAQSAGNLNKDASDDR